MSQQATKSVSDTIGQSTQNTQNRSKRSGKSRRKNSKTSDDTVTIQSTEPIADIKSQPAEKITLVSNSQPHMRASAENYIPKHIRSNDHHQQPSTKQQGPFFTHTVPVNNGMTHGNGTVMSYPPQQMFASQTGMPGMQNSAHIGFYSNRGIMQQEHLQRKPFGMHTKEQQSSNFGIKPPHAFTDKPYQESMQQQSTDPFPHASKEKGSSRKHHNTHTVNQKMDGIDKTDRMPTSTSTSDVSNLTPSMLFENIKKAHASERSEDVAKQTISKLIAKNKQGTLYYNDIINGLTAKLQSNRFALFDWYISSSDRLATFESIGTIFYNMGYQVQFSTRTLNDSGPYSATLMIYKM